MFFAPSLILALKIRPKNNLGIPLTMYELRPGSKRAASSLSQVFFDRRSQKFSLENEMVVYDNELIITRS